MVESIPKESVVAPSARETHYTKWVTKTIEVVGIDARDTTNSKKTNSHKK